MDRYTRKQRLVIGGSWLLAVFALFGPMGFVFTPTGMDLVLAVGDLVPVEWESVKYKAAFCTSVIGVINCLLMFGVAAIIEKWNYRHWSEAAEFVQGLLIFLAVLCMAACVLVIVVTLAPLLF